MIDSHCHIGFDELKSNAAELVERAKKQGISKILTVACNEEQLEDLKDILSKFDIVYGAFGIHPNESQHLIDAAKLKRLIQSHPKIIAVGETGLDYHYDTTPPNQQRQNFMTHLKAALELDLPVIIHSREAELDTIGVLELFKNSGLRGVFHCYTGKMCLAEYAMKVGFYVSASGVITFDKSQELRDIFAQIPLDKLLIETDSPYLAPMPYRGRLNEPSFLPKTAEKLAEIKGVSLQTLDEETTNNFNHLFFKGKS